MDIKQPIALILILAANETLDGSGSPLCSFHPLFILLSQSLSSILWQYDFKAFKRTKSVLSFSLLHILTIVETPLAPSVHYTLNSQFLAPSAIGTLSALCRLPLRCGMLFQFLFTLCDDQNTGMVPQWVSSTHVLVATFCHCSF